MSVICFASLKGGVGKTSLSINVGHAFANRGCETLLIDCDPTAHASRFFHHTVPSFPGQSPLAKIFLTPDEAQKSNDKRSIVDTADSTNVPIHVPVRPRLSVLPATAELRHFMWGRGARFFSSSFSRLISELKSTFDQIIIDTAPDFNVVTRNAIAVSDLVVVPVDSSEMSIHSLEEIVASARHIEGPKWAIIRSMVNRQASRVHQLTANSLKETMSPIAHQDLLTDLDTSIENTKEFVDRLNSGGHRLNDVGRSKDDDMAGRDNNEGNGQLSPIYLLNSLVYRTEQQNKLTFTGKTSFEQNATAKLAQQYLAVAKELEDLLSIVTEQDDSPEMDNFFSESLGLSH